MDECIAHPTDGLHFAGPCGRHVHRRSLGCTPGISFRRDRSHNAPWLAPSHAPLSAALLERRLPPSARLSGASHFIQSADVVSSDVEIEARYPGAAPALRGARRGGQGGRRGLHAIEVEVEQREMNHHASRRPRDVHHIAAQRPASRAPVCRSHVRRSGRAGLLSLRSTSADSSPVRGGARTRRPTQCARPA